MNRQSNSLKLLVVFLALVLTVETGYLVWSKYGGAGPSGEKSRKILYWRAPMDPSYISDKPGKSPMGMDLVPVYADEQPVARTDMKMQETTQGQPAETDTIYTCPMHPEVISHEPGKCPICGMDLVTKEVPRAATVKLAPNVIQKIGVRTAEVAVYPLKRTIRTVGNITYDETRVVDITTKVAGWVEKLYVDFTGQTVRKGQRLIDIYSPDLVSTQEEYLLALESKNSLGQSRFPEVSGGALSLLGSTRRRLQLWDITDQQIENLEKEKKVQRLMTIYSPRQGIVTEKMVFEGGYVKPDMPLYRIADLGKVWVNVSIYEYELPWVKSGETALMTLAYAPGKTYEGKINFIYPYLEEKTRTVKVRLEYPNPDLELKPEMYADVVIESPVTVRALAVPDEAVIRSGDRNVIVVDRGDGVFEPRGVTLGIEADNHFQVTKGLTAGERVVTSAQFLIDSESRLKEAIQKMLARKQFEGQEPAKSMPPSNQH